MQEQGACGGQSEEKKEQNAKTGRMVRKKAKTKSVSGGETGSMGSEFEGKTLGNSKMNAQKDVPATSLSSYCN